MWDIHREIVRRAVAGQKQVDIARDLGVTPVMVSYTLNSTVVREHLSDLHERRDAQTADIAQHIKETLPLATKLYQDILTRGTDEYELSDIRDKIKVAGEILDRGGYGKVTKVQGSFTHGHFTPEDILALKERAKAMAVQRGMIVDTTAEEA